MKHRLVLSAVVCLFCGLSAAHAHELPEGAAPLRQAKECADIAIRCIQGMAGVHSRR